VVAKLRSQAGGRGPDAKRTRAPSTTRRRLLLALSALLATFVLALATQLRGLRRMEATFTEMRDHETEMRLALELEDAVRDRYAHEARFAMGERAAHPDVVAARRRAERLLRQLREQVDEPEARAALGEIATAGAELDRAFPDPDRRLVLAADAGTAPLLEHAFALVTKIEGDVDRLFAVLQRSTISSREQLVALEQSAIRWLGGLLLLAPLLVAAAALYLYRAVARPLARLSRGADALARGDLDVRIDVDTPDEFGALAAGLNAMTLSLRQHQVRLVESEKLAGLGRVAAGVAHELNNPLQVMIGYLSLHRDVPDRRLAEQLAAIEEEAYRCRDVVESLLELARPTVPAPGPVDLRAVCEDVSERLQGVGPRVARLTLDGGARALADRPRVRQVVFNLLRNAIEAAGPEGEVEVRLGVSGDAAELSVRDSGPGIAPGARERLFEPFFTTKSNGTGLGLAVSRAIARAHGGDIEAENAPGGGAVFRLRLPRADEISSR
jgi:signal transduction histidine kinase